MVGQFPTTNSTHVPMEQPHQYKIILTLNKDVRTWSNRTYNAECVNSENQLGGHLADGTAYTHVDGSEYNGIFPVWDWQKV